MCKFSTTECARKVLRMKCNIDRSLKGNTEEQKGKIQENGFTVNKNMKQQIQVKQDCVKLKQIQIP